MAELITGFIIGVILLVFSCIIFRLELKWLMRFLLNSVLGGILLVGFDLFNIVSLPINPLNALISGYLGIFGIAVIFVITKFL